MLLLNELKAKIIEQVDEVDLIDLLNLTTEDIVNAFSYRIEDMAETIEEQLEL